MASSSYRQIFKSTSIIGGSSLVNLILGMVRTKFVALFIGSAGIGLTGTYNNLIGLTSTLANIGLGSSGVKHIAAAGGKDGVPEEQSSAIAVFYALNRITAVIGLLILLFLCYPISLYTFGNASYAMPIAFLGVVVFFNLLSLGQRVVLQGTRRIGAMAQVSLYGGILSVLIAIPMYYFLGQRGIVPVLILSSVVYLFLSWLFIRRSEIAIRLAGWQEIKLNAKPFLILGGAFVLQGLCGPVMAYVNNIILLRYLGLEKCGLYYSAMNLSGALVNFVLAAMATDYYPRLVEFSNDHTKMQDTVNEQSEMALLLSLPGVLFMIVFAPLIMRVFYTSAFVDAVFPLQLLTLGIMGRVISWPIGFVLLARSDKVWMITTEVISTAIQIVFLWIGITYWQLTGAALAFGCGYAVYIFLIFGCVWWRHGVYVNRTNLILGGGFMLATIGTIFWQHCIEQPIWRWAGGVGILMGFSVCNLLVLKKRLQLDFGRTVQRLLHR